MIFLKQAAVLVLVVPFMFACSTKTTTYTTYGKSFDSVDDAVDHHRVANTLAAREVQAGINFGGSMMVYMPADQLLLSPPFGSGRSLSVAMQKFSLGIHGNNFTGLMDAMIESAMFDSVALKQVPGYLRYAKNNGYRYLTVVNGDGTYTVYDLYLKKDKVVQPPKGYENFISVLEDTIEKFESNVSSKRLAASFEPVKQFYNYDDLTQKGYLAVEGKGIEARGWMLAKIGEIAASKNVGLKSGVKLKPGTFAVLDEGIENGVFTIQFETYY